LDAAQAVAVQHRAFEQVGDGCEPDVRMRPHVVAVAGTGGNRSEVVEEDKRPYTLSRREPRQQSAHQESAAEVVAARLYQFLDGHRCYLRTGATSAAISVVT
jgi:hypothetical protein